MANFEPPETARGRNNSEEERELDDTAVPDIEPEIETDLELLSVQVSPFHSDLHRKHESPP
ncbi:hypothetical protein D3C80_1776370 [compost metagenome]